MEAEHFVGRTVELGQLCSAVDAAVGGRGSLLLIVGEPGIGKTRLIEAVAEHAASQGASVRWASCWEGPTAPFWPWTQLVRTADEESSPPAATAFAGTVDELLSRTDTHAEAESESVRLVLFEAVASYFRAHAARQPVLLVIDDLHWSDVPSLRLLDFFARDLRAAPIAVIGCYRDVEAAHDREVSAAIEGVAGRAKLTKLEGLSEPEVASLLETTIGSTPRPGLARAVFDRTEGNPLYVSELARLLVAQKKVDQPPGTLPIPEGVQGVLRRRLARLSQPCHDLLQLASVVGQEFRIDVLASARGLTLEEAVRVLDEAESARLVAPSEHSVGRYAFSHALVRDVLYGAIPTSARAAMHRRVGSVMEALVADDPDPHLSSLAHHFLSSLDAADLLKGIDFSARAGRRALDELAYEEAVGHYRRAVDVLELAPDSAHRPELLLELGEALLRAGDLPGAREVFTGAADVARRRRDPEALARAALGFGAGLSGFEIRMADRTQLDLLEEALGALRDDDSALRAWILARLSVARSMLESVSGRRAFAEEAVAMARRVGDRRALAYALSALCDASAGPADCETRIGWATEIVDLARADGDRPMELLGRRLLLEALLEVGDIAGVNTQVDAFALVADSLRQPLYSWYVALWRGMQALLGGRFTDALRFADEAEEIGRRAHSTNAPMLASVLRWMVELQRNRPAEALEASRAVFELLPHYGADYNEMFDVLCLALSGQIDRATPSIGRLLKVMKSLDVDSEWLPTTCQCSETFALCGDRDASSELYLMILPYRNRFGVEGIGAAMHGSMEYHLGLLARAMGRREVAEEHFVAAVEANERLGAPVLVARARRELASVLAERGENQRAAALASGAEKTFRELGIDEWADAASDIASDRGTSALGNTFRSEGDFWTLSYEGAAVRVKDAKGLHDLATLLARPGTRLAALDLATERGEVTHATGDALHGPGHAGEILDDDARAAYKERLAELEEEIADAEALGDAVRGERAKAERDAIAAELAAAYGLGGRARRAGDPAERARTAVTRRIRDAISRIDEAHPSLGRHLRNSVRTGAFCSYEPEQLVSWEI